MTVLQFPIDERLLAQAGLKPGQEGEGVRVLAAVKLFELRRITLGQAGVERPFPVGLSRGVG